MHGWTRRGVCGQPIALLLRGNLSAGLQRLRDCIGKSSWRLGVLGQKDSRLDDFEFH
jgi:hypothetical protein